MSRKWAFLGGGRVFVPYPTPYPSNVSDATHTPPQAVFGARAWTQSFVHDSLVYLGTTPGVHPYSWLHQELWACCSCHGPLAQGDLVLSLCSTMTEQQCQVL